MAQVPLPQCGGPITALGAGTGSFAMEGVFPPRADRAGDGTFTGRVTVTASGEAVRGVTSPEADVYVTQGGQVVATPLAKDLIARPITLSPGSREEFLARGTLRPCADARGGLLPPGRYDVFAAVTIVDDSGSSILVTGGPWPIAVA